MATNMRGPRIQKGALASLEAHAPSPHIIAFQYNPATLKRSLKPQLVGGEAGDRSQAVRIAGAPTATISVEIEIDATDELEKGASNAQSLGIQPQLAELELLVFPPSSRVISNAALLSLGTIEIAPITAPRLLFIWGQHRVLPVRLSSYSISEEEFDASLNPIRATVSLEMQVLSYSDLSVGNADYHQYLAYQQSLEAIARSVGRSGAAPLGAAAIVR